MASFGELVRPSRVAPLVLSIAVLLGSSLSTTVARAQPADATRRASDSYELGDRLAKQGKWAEATAAFARADELAPNDTALESALEASLRADDPVVGMGLVERASRNDTSRALPVVARAKEKFASRVGAIEIACVAAASRCRVTIDGREVTTIRTWARPGAYRVAFEGAGDPVSVQVAAGETRPVSPPDVAPKTLPPPVGDAPPEASSGGVSPLWILLPGALTVGFGVTTAVFGVRTKDLERELEDRQGGRLGDYEEAREIYDDGEAAEDVTNVFLGLAIASAAATAAVTILVIVASPDGGAETPAVEARITPTAGGAAGVIRGAF